MVEMLQILHRAEMLRCCTWVTLPDPPYFIPARPDIVNLGAGLSFSKCAGSSWMFENRAPHIADGDYTPLSSVNIFVKDLGIVTDEASRHEAVTPLSDTALSLYQKASESGLGSEDDSAIAKILAQQSNITLPGSNT